MMSGLARVCSRVPRTLALSLMLLSAALVWTPWTYTEAAYLSDDELVASVDVDSIRGTIEALEAFGSREFHLESSRQAAEYLRTEFEGMGVEVEMQTFTVGDAEVSNVVATIDGSDGDAGTYLFGAHYDSENRDVNNLSAAENLTAPGADDDASGVAAVLEIARVLAGSGFPGTVRFVMFGAEEMGYDNSGGCRGSEYFVTQEVAAGRNYSGTAILDMIGYQGSIDNKTTLVLNTVEQSLTGSTQEAVGTFGIDLEVDVLVVPQLTYSDHGSFWEAGIPSMLVIEELDGSYFPLNPYYHTSYDTTDTLSLGQVVAVTQALLGGLLLLEDECAEVEDRSDLLLFGVALMSAATVSAAAFMYVRGRRGGRSDDG